MRPFAVHRLSMRNLAIACAGALCIASANAAEAPDSSLFDRATQRLATTWHDGQTELYLPLHAHHLRSAYSREKIDGFNENAYGLGIGRGGYDQDGDWHGLYVMGFQDSHYQPQYMAGYGYKTYWKVAGELKAGLGYTAFLTARSDIGHYTPIPGILPIASLEYRKVSLDASYVPGGKGFGNILFFWGKFHF
jgi:palmitoyl transferase